MVDHVCTTISTSVPCRIDISLEINKALKFTMYVIFYINRSESYFTKSGVSQKQFGIHYKDMQLARIAKFLLCADDLKLLLAIKGIETICALDTIGVTSFNSMSIITFGRSS